MIFKGKSYDKMYLNLCEDVINNGYSDSNPRAKYKDGESSTCKSLFVKELVLTPNDIPVLFSKKLYFRQAIEEILWIWQKRSIVVKDLQDKKVHIWDDWKKKDGTIGKAYGYQLDKKVFNSDLNQVDYLIKELKNNPDSRRHITQLWNVDDLHDMALTPCVYETHWFVRNGVLDCKVTIRSNDLALGNPFNVFQYWILHKLIANECNLGFGNVIFSIDIPHVYTRHINTLKNQIERFNEINKIDPVDLKNVTIKIADKPFYDIKTEDIEVIDYNTFGGEPLKKFHFDVAI